jgi:uncharacterized protein YjiS (DUF1127 family)
MTIFPFDTTQFPEFLINLLRWKSHIQSAENLSDRSLEDIGLAPHGRDFFDAVKPFWEA